MACLKLMGFFPMTLIINEIYSTWHPLINLVLYGKFPPSTAMIFSHPHSPSKSFAPSVTYKGMNYTTSVVFSHPFLLLNGIYEYGLAILVLYGIFETTKSPIFSSSTFPLNIPYYTYHIYRLLYHFYTGYTCGYL